MTTATDRIGAPILPPAIAYAVLTVLSVAAPPVLAGITPWSSDANLLDFYAHHADAAHALAFLTVGAAIPFGIVTAVAVSRIRTLGFEVPGRMISLVGGIVAAAMLALSGLVQLALTAHGVSGSPEVVRGLSALSTAAGGPGFVLFEGLLVAGISVIGLLGGALPRSLAWFGLAVAAVSELAILTVAFSGSGFLLPLGRFGSLIWIVAVAILLPASRKDPRFRGSAAAAGAAR
jgi:type IV secretory pathway TrbD component